MTPTKRKLKKQIKAEMQKIAQSLGLENFIFNNDPTNVVYQIWRDGKEVVKEILDRPDQPLRNALQELTTPPDTASDAPPDGDTPSEDKAPDEQLEASTEEGQGSVEEDKIEVDNEEFSLPQKKKGGRPKKTETK